VRNRLLRDEKVPFKVLEIHGNDVKMQLQTKEMKFQDYYYDVQIRHSDPGKELNRSNN
jgi:hypothetical protein